MKFDSIMHVTFFTKNFETMRRFYEGTLGLKPKVITYYRSYRSSDNRLFRELAEKTPDEIAFMYIEIAPGQFIELFPMFEGQLEHDAWNERLGYSHFALLVEDIFETRRQLECAGVALDTPITKGPSETYQMWMHDPDGNMFEIMQYTDRSLQIVGNC